MPAELAGLVQLTQLKLHTNPVESGWQHLPHQLRDLSLSYCGLRQLPPLASLDQPTYLNLGGNYIQSGWQHLPRQLRELDLHSCSLQQVPAPLAALDQLTQLKLSTNRNIVSGWQHLPWQLRNLDVYGCGLQQVPADLAGRPLKIGGLQT